MTKSKGIQAQRKVKIEERRAKVAANLLGGHTYRTIAAALSTSIATVCRDVAILMRRWRKEQIQAADHWVLLQSRRLDQAINAIWDKVISGDLAAIDRLQRLIEQHARLMGYAPNSDNGWRQQVAILLLNGTVTPAEVEQELGLELAEELFKSIGLSHPKGSRKGRQAADEAEDESAQPD